MFALCVSDIISVKSRVEEGKWVSLEAKDCYSFQCSGSLLSVYTVIEMFLNLCPILLFPFPSISHYFWLFIPLSVPHLTLYSPFLLVSLLLRSFHCFFLLPAEQRDSVTVAYLCGNHLLLLSSTASIDEPVAELHPPLWRKGFFFFFQPNQKNVEMHVSFNL